MQTRIDFINVRRDEKLVDFIEKRSSAVRRRLKKHADADQAAELHMRLIGSAYNKEGLLKEVITEGLVVLPYRKSFSVRKKGQQFNHTIVEVFSSIEKVLERESERKNTERRREGLVRKGKR